MNWIGGIAFFLALCFITGWMDGRDAQYADKPAQVAKWQR